MGEEKAIGDRREGHKLEVPVERRRSLVDGVHYDRRGGNLLCLNQGAVQGVRQKELADALPVMAPIDGEAAEQRRRD